MAVPGYRSDQWSRRYDSHVQPLNRVIDDLGSHDTAGPPPYIAPMYRGVAARGLVILRDPGPKAGGDMGSGFLSVENDDPTAERELNFMTEAGIDPAEFIPWNAYPWFINAGPSTVQLRAGTEPLRRVIDLLPDLRVVLLQGGHARKAWQYFMREHGDMVAARGIDVLATYHPGRQALWHQDPAVRVAREQAIRDTFAQAAALLRDDVPRGAAP